MTQGELMNRNTLAKSLVINRDLPQGEVITEAMIDVKSPGRGVQPNRRGDLIGKTAKRPFRAGDFFFASDIEENGVVARNYTFKREWGIPIRYHDFQRMMKKSNWMKSMAMTSTHILMPEMPSSRNSTHEKN
jgi:N-acetylneuraminate synthase